MSDESGGYPGAPPGWYTDPAGGPGQRWWDGYAWTEATVAPAPPPPPPSPSSTLPPPPLAHPGAYPAAAPPPPPAPGYGSAPSYGAPGYTRYPHEAPSYATPGYGGYGYTAGPHPEQVRAAVAEELRFVTRGRNAIIAKGLVVIAELIAYVSQCSAWRTFGHEFRLSLQAAQNHLPAPTVTAPSNGWTALFGLVGLVALVFECMWQFRAATAARTLLRPARRTPGWGVGFRFIPVVNLWMPYQAIRDCLPPDDARRRLVLRWWLLGLARSVVVALTIIGLAITTPLGVAFAMVAALLSFVTMATGSQMVNVVAASHQAELAR